MRSTWFTAQNRIFVNILWYTVPKEGFLMAQFVDRELEIATLEKEYAKKEASLVIVYGRRREKIFSCMREKNAVK